MIMNNIAYLRCSSDEQSVEHQESSIREYAARNDIVIDKIIKDEGISAYRRDVSARDGFMEVLEMARSGLIENLIVFESSRISRGFIEAQNIIDELTRCGVKIHSVSENCIINQNELDSLMIAFRAFMNQKASKETGMRVRSAHELLRKEGKWAAGTIPYGYKLVDGYAVIDEELQPIITEMFNDYIHYPSNKVQEKYHIKNRKTLIDRISHPMSEAIVGSDLFIRANKVRESRKCSRDSSTGSLNRTDILYEGLVYHKCCGSRLYMNRDYRTKNHVHSYRCKTCRGDESITSKKSFSGTKLDSYLDEQVVQILNGLNHDALIDKYSERKRARLAVLIVKRDGLMNSRSSKQRAVQKAQEKLETYILNDAPDTTINTISSMISNISVELLEIEEQLGIVDNDIESVQDKIVQDEALVREILNAKDIYESATIEQKKAILQLLINRIEVADVDSVDIYLNI